MAYPNVTALKAAAKEIKVADKSVLLDDGSCIPYDRLCISVGASPKVFSASLSTAVSQS